MSAYNKVNLSVQNSKSFFNTRFSPVFLVIFLVVAISFITRLALLIKTGNGFQYNLVNIVGSLGIGLLFDLAMSAYLIIPFIGINSFIRKPKL